MEAVTTDGQLYSDEYFLKLGPRRFVNKKQTKNLAGLLKAPGNTFSWKKNSSSQGW